MRIGDQRYRLKGFYGSNFALNEASHERSVLAVMRRWLPSRSGAFLDVGVNIGQTLHKLLSIDRAREYYGFEPLISCCDDVVRFAELNGLNNIHVLPIGLSNENIIAPFYSHDLFDSMASLIPDGHEHKTLVQLRRGDEVIRELNINKVAAIKVDVEGAEWQVFDGLRDTLKRDKPLLLFEVLPNFVGQEKTRIYREQARANAERLDKLVSVLSDCGYQIRSLHPNGDEEPIDRPNLEDVSAYVSNDFTAYPLIQ
jgi:FkbM family methyltransferase